MSSSELATSYAALILADDGVEITADKLQSLIKASGADTVDPAASNIYAKALEGKDVKDLLLNTNVGNNGASVPSARIQPTLPLPEFDETVGAFILAFLATRVPPSKEKIEVVLDSVAIKPDNDFEQLIKQLLGTSMSG